jgi:hypothetical protein
MFNDQSPAWLLLFSSVLTNEWTNECEGDGRQPGHILQWIGWCEATWFVSHALVLSDSDYLLPSLSQCLSLSGRVKSPLISVNRCDSLSRKIRSLFYTADSSPPFEYSVTQQDESVSTVEQSSHFHCPTKNVTLALRSANEQWDIYCHLPWPLYEIDRH